MTAGMGSEEGGGEEKEKEREREEKMEGLEGRRSTVWEEEG